MCRSPSCRPVSSLSHARQAALCAAAGHLQQGATGITAALVAVQALRRHAVPHAQVYDYVPGHLGVVPNEIADVLSKIAASADAPTCGLQVPDYTALWLGNGASKLACMLLFAAASEMCLCHPSISRTLAMIAIMQASVPPTFLLPLHRLRCRCLTGSLATARLV